MDVPQTSPRTLAKATAGAVIAAAAVFILFVLPAEAAIDPTGVGSALGLTRMADEPAEARATAPASASAQPVGPLAIPDKATITKAAPWRSDEMTITLEPHSGAEIKAHMNKGDHFVFHWEAKGGSVKADMHGERKNAPDGEFTSYWAERELGQAQGSITAPFAGTHGWYWRNRGETPVKITVRTTGFYKDLFLPHQG